MFDAVASPLLPMSRAFESMDASEDSGEDDHPELPPPRAVWLAERRVYAAAARLRDLEAMVAEPDSGREAQLAYRTAWLRFMVSLCNLPLAERPQAVEHVLEALREAHLLRPTGERDQPCRPDATPRQVDVPPKPSDD